MASPEYSEAERSTRIFDFKDQNYEELKRQHLQEKSLFIDPEFPANANSLKFSRYKDSQWSRPKEICEPLAPQFIREGMARTDVVQGELGDCWFMAVAASLTMYPKLLKRVVPWGQSFDPKDYAGIFHFQFWQFGEWVDVVVDDQLPCITLLGEHTKLLFGSSAERDEFWMPLLEKAYAKLNGSYRAIHGGLVNKALVDLTGGIGNNIMLQEIGPHVNLWKMMKEVLDTKSLMGASIRKTFAQLGFKSWKGLERLHAYSITAVEKVIVDGKKRKLVRLRNPYGHGEWVGEWSDNDVQNWSKVDPDQQKKLFEKKEDGEFWMKLSDFRTRFDRLFVCYLSNEAPKEEADSFRWHSSCFHGRWKRAEDDNPSETLWMNPQFYVSLQDPDEDASICTLVSLMQRDLCRTEDMNCLSIGIAVYKVMDEYLKLKDPAQRKMVLSNLRTEREVIYQKTEDRTEHFELSSGHYVIVPRVNSSEEEADFLLRIFTETEHESLDISLD